RAVGLLQHDVEARVSRHRHHSVLIQNELNQLALNQNTVVTLPGNTRFYIVLQQTNSPSCLTPSARRLNYVYGSTNNRQSVPSLQELRQLLQLRQELSELHQGGLAEKPVSDDSQQQ